MSPKGVRRIVRSLTVQEKLQAIDRVHNGESKAAVARHIAVPESTLRGWCKSEEKLRAAPLQDALPNASPNSSHALLPQPLDVPLDFSKDGNYSSPSEESTASDSIKQEPDMCWVQRDQPTQPETESASWFWNLCKTDGLSITPSIKYEDENTATTVNSAVHHGDSFLKWLEGCSDPSITALELVQFRKLLTKVKECASRREKGRISNIPRVRPGRK